MRCIANLILVAVTLVCFGYCMVMTGLSCHAGIIILLACAIALYELNAPPDGDGESPTP